MAEQVTAALLKENILRYSQNPTALFRTMMLAMEQQSEGKYYLVDPSNPFAFLQEMSCMLASAQMSEARTIARELYPSLAETYSELSRHMSDTDHLDRFSTPGKATIDIWLLYDEVINRAVALTDSPTSIRKLTIARNTRITVGGYPFTLQYPVDIMVKPSGGIMAVYDTTIESPFMKLSTNKVDWTVVKAANKRYIVLRIPTWQMGCSTEIEALNAVTGFSKAFKYTSEYFYTRAFIKNTGESTWTEIKTTHSEQVFDSNDPTVVLSVDTVNKTVLVTVPQIYFNNGLIRSELRIDIYTTNGVVDLSLRNFDVSNYSAKWIDLDDPTSANFRAPMNNFSDMLIRSDDVITGGTAPMSFEELREKVITNALDTPLIPLSLGGLQTTLNKAGFNMVLNVDNITDREILATRLLPTPTTYINGSSIGVTVGTALTRLSDWQNNDGIADNGIRMTIKPEAVFDLRDGKMTLVPSDTINTLTNRTLTSTEELATAVNQNVYAFTPFFYVLDIQNETFSVRPYRLDKPILKSHFFEKENIEAGAGVSANASAVEFAPTKDGWDVYISVVGDGLWGAFDIEDTFTQLSYLDPTTGVRYHVNGTQVTAIDPETNKPVDNLYVYQFSLGTNFDIDAKHRIRMNANGLIDLEQMFDLVFFVKNWLPADVHYSSIDQLIDTGSVPGHVLGDTYLGLTHESLTIHFGDYLENLWRRSRSIVGANEYVLNTVTTYKTHDKTIYEQDPVSGQIAVTWNAVSEELEYTVLHYAGEPVFVSATELTSTESSTAGDTTVSFTGGAPVLAPDTRYAFSFWGAGVDGKPLVGTCTAGPTANELTLSLPTTTDTAAGAKFILGEQEIAGEIGQPTLDAEGNPIPISDRPSGMKREFDILLMDGRYYFADDEQTIADKEEAIDFISSWLEEELEEIANRVIERTNLFFFPTITFGKIPATMAGEQIVMVNAEQALSVTYYLPEDRYNNDNLRKALEASTPIRIAEALANRTVSRTLLERALLDASSSDAVSVEVSGFNVDGAQTLTFHDPMTRASLAKTLALTPAGQLQVIEAVDVRFERYSD